MDNESIRALDDVNPGDEITLRIKPYLDGVFVCGPVRHSGKFLNWRGELFCWEEGGRAIMTRLSRISKLRIKRRAATSR